MKPGAFLPLFFFIFLTATTCAGKESDPVPQTMDYLAWPALALLRTGENPLWFEIGQAGPNLIDSPASSALVPYAPWPHARFITGIQVWEDYLVMAVNRDGFLILGAAGADLFLYRAADSALWDPFTVESFFIWEERPAVLLYRNTFFSESSLSSEFSMGMKVAVLDKSSPTPLTARIPALELPQSREVEVLRRGFDGYWYFRAKEKGNTHNETTYYRARELSEESERISVEEWRNSDCPVNTGIPPLLYAILDMAGNPASGFGVLVPAIRTISPDFEGQRFFCLAEASSENLQKLYGYCRESPSLALAILPNGMGLLSSGTDVNLFSLPVLPEGFIYNGIAVLGNVLAASWEEQLDAGIGAAGFLVQSLAAILP